MDRVLQPTRPFGRSDPRGFDATMGEPSLKLYQILLELEDQLLQSRYQKRAPERAPNDIE